MSVKTDSLDSRQQSRDDKESWPIAQREYPLLHGRRFDGAY